jgi:hypothetical protein
MKIGMARQDGPAIRPSFLVFYQSGANEISQNVKADFRKRATPSLVLAQDMVVRLMLKVVRAQRNTKMFAQKFHAVSLVTIAPQSHPKQMNVIRHETIDRTKETFTGGGVQHHFPKAGMKNFVEPADAAPGDRHCPMNHGIALIMFTIQARKVEVADYTLAGKPMDCTDGWLGLHKWRLEPAHAGCYLYFVEANVNSLCSIKAVGTGSHASCYKNKKEKKSRSEERLP